MIYLKYIFFFFTFLYSYEIIDSSLILEDNINQEAILIPNYEDQFPAFKREFLGKSKKFFIDVDAGYASSNSIKLNFSPHFKGKKINFKVNFDYFINNSDFNHWGPIDIIEKIEYFNLKLFKDRFDLFLGEINNLSFGHGYLLNNYCNSHKYPIVRNLGLIFKYRNYNSSLTYDLFISSLREISNSGGLIGNRISFLLSENFPLKLGFGHIIDLNQFIHYKNEIQNVNRQINAFEIDFSYPMINFFNEKLLFIGEISAIDIPEKRYYKRTDDDEFNDDKKSRGGIWGIAFPGLKYINKSFEFLLTANYNSSIYSPYYFNSSYDFEKVRYRHYNILEGKLYYQY